jgi:tetratricopeptide (TPR) repeat protein
MSKPFSAPIVLEIDELRNQGYVALREGKINEAEEKFLAAWNLVPNANKPELQNEYNYFEQRIPWGMVKFYRDVRQFSKAFAWLETVRKAYGPGWNPSVEFLAATVHHDSGDIRKAFEIFDVLYKKYKQRPFPGEDKKYLEFYLNQAAEIKQGQTSPGVEHGTFRAE